MSSYNEDEKKQEHLCFGDVLSHQQEKKTKRLEWHPGVLYLFFSKKSASSGRFDFATTQLESSRLFPSTNGNILHNSI
jgi:hypothetical protein